MQAVPLIRTKWSNEKLMTALLLVILLWLIPRWAANPFDILGFAGLLAFGLILDVAANFLRFRRPVCAVSAAVTAALLHALSPGTPLWGKLITLAFAVLAGKHIWGGTGKNLVNPAMAGLLLLSVLFPVKSPAFSPTLLLLPALLLSLPFALFRPYASAGMLAGVAAALLLHGGFDWGNFLSYGVILWSCLVITDPVTTTAKPLPGAVIGALAGFVPLALGGSAAYMALGVLASNLLSLAIDRIWLGAGAKMRLTFRKGKLPFSQADTECLELAGEASKVEGIHDLAADEILGRIERNGVFGCGGAAFPTATKIEAVLASKAKQKHLIVNAVECDPGLIHDKWLLRNRAEQIAEGIRLLGLLTPFASVTLAAKDVSGLSFPAGIRLFQAKDYYPAGAERELIRSALGRKLDDGALPAAEGILVLNVQTVCMVYEAVALDRPADTRYITLANLFTHTVNVAKVRLGDKAQSVVEQFAPSASFAFAGGGMMQARMLADDAALDKAVNFLAVGPAPDYRESLLCSRCGLCAAVCPAGLPVADIARLAGDGRWEKAAGLHPEKCVACGACSSVCLAGRNLSAKVASAKAMSKRQEF